MKGGHGQLVCGCCGEWQQQAALAHKESSRACVVGGGGRVEGQ